MTPKENQTIQDIANFAMLKFNENIIVEHSDDMNLDLDSILGPQIDNSDYAGLFKTEGRDNDFPDFDIPDLEDESPFDEDGNILEPLGEYYSVEKKIVVYDERCKWTAERLKVDPQVLIDKVFAHEAGHAVSHLGKDKEGNIWTNFGQASRNNVELFAQLYAFKLFEEKENADALDAMQKLGRNQTRPYHVYQKHVHKSQQEIYDLLIEIRKIVSASPLKATGVPQNPNTKWFKLKDVADITRWKTRYDDVEIITEKNNPNITVVRRVGDVVNYTITGKNNPDLYYKDFIAVGYSWLSPASGVVAMWENYFFFEKKALDVLKRKAVKSPINLDVCYIISTKDHNVELEYLFEILNSPTYRRIFCKMAKGSILPRIDKVNLENLLIPIPTTTKGFPSLQDQESILAEIKKYEFDACRALQQRNNVLRNHL